MKIERLDIETVQVNERETWVFVLLHTDKGISGLGELNPSAPRAACVDALRRMGEYLAGRDPRRVRALYDELNTGSLDLAGVRALSAVDQCLWDILGKSLDAPVHALLGGRCRDEIRLYANITRATPQLTPEAFVASARGAVADGFTAVKVAPFGGKYPIESLAGLEQGIECVRRVRQAVGPDVDVMLDCYGLFSAEAALALLEALGDVDLFWFEEPVADDDWDGYHRVRGASGLRLAGGERYEFGRGFWEALERRIFQVAMPDVGIVGGIGALHEVALMAGSRDIQVAPHGPFGPVTLAASAQVMAAHACFLTMEFPWGLNDWRRDLVMPTERVSGSRYRLPDGPGLGATLNPEALAAHRA